MKTYVDVNLIPENPAENKIKKIYNWFLSNTCLNCMSPLVVDLFQ